MNEQNQHIDELIAKKLSNEINADEEILLQEWINSSSVNRNHYLELSAIWNAVETPTIDTEKAWNKIEPQLKTKTIPLFRYISYAVAAIVIIALGFVFIIQSNKTNTIQLVAENNTASVYLQDSSLVEINANSSLKYPEIFNKDTRKVFLAGEGFFSITKNAEKPFIVHTELADIKVLGTSFFVKTNTESVEVFVKTGKVEVMALNSEEKIVLEKGESARYNSRLKKFESENTISTIGFWNKNAISFNKARLADVAKTLSDLYKKPIIIKSIEIENCKIQADFYNGESLETILKILETTLSVNITSKSDTIEIEGDSCE